MIFDHVLVYLAIFPFISALVVVARFLFARCIRLIDALAIPSVLALSGGAQCAVSGPSAALAAGIAFSASLLPSLRKRFPGLHPTGLALLLALVQTGGACLVLAPLTLTSDGAGIWTRVLIATQLAVLLLGLPPVLLRAYFAWEVLLRDKWRRPVRSMAHYKPGGPVVSVHVVCCGEPPEPVVQTLDALGLVAYGAFEVIVVENGSEEGHDWTPVRDRCRLLGERFQFHRVERPAGGRAAALNHALAHTSREAGIVAVVDAGVVVTPDFAARLTGCFEDVKVGRVQTWPDYRGWFHSRFMTGCFWEARLLWSGTMRGFDERRAGFPAGGVYLLRRDALEATGGWAEWSLAEGHELGIRLAAAGYVSLVVNETFGREPLSETYAVYRARQHRRVLGITQTVRHHRRLLLPGRWAVPSALTPGQRVCAVLPLLDQVRRSGGLLLLPLAVATALLGVLHHEHVGVRWELWLAIAAAYATAATLRWCLCARAGGSLEDAVLAALLSSSLAHTTATATLRGLLTWGAGHPRVPEVRDLSPLGRVLRAACAHTCVAAVLLTVAAVTLAHRPAGSGLLLGVWLLLRGLRYLTPLAVAVLAERGLRDRPRHQDQDYMAASVARLRWGPSRR
ncbi:glycosyltransferase family 2 protein [Streptomyces lavendulae]|uniref:glycosyltransferase family 2 protein n=1 Tax=Streptomyces lavendulae TaxID=1914 RepID=UPI0031E5E6F9